MAIQPVSEKAFQRTVIDVARALGWICASFRPGRTARGWRTAVQGDGVGFPDTLLIHPRRGQIVVAELKVGKNRASLAQDAWLDAFRAAGVPAYLWRPEDWPEIEAVLRGEWQ